MTTLYDPSKPITIETFNQLLQAAQIRSLASRHLIWRVHFPSEGHEPHLYLDRVSQQKLIHEITTRFNLTYSEAFEIVRNLIAQAKW